MDAITATDDEIRAVLAEAEVPPLLPALAYVTGDLSLLRDDLRPDPILMGLPQGGMTAEQQATARASRSTRWCGSATTDPGSLPHPGATTCCGSRRTSWAAPTWPSTCRCSKRSSRSGATTGARRSGARPTSHPTPTSASR